MLNKIKQLSNHQGFLRYFKNTSWLMGERILRMAVGLFVGIWVARYLGPEQFGLFSYAQSFVGLFTALATLGLDGIIVRELVKDESKRDVLLGTGFTLKFIGAFVVLLVLVFTASFISTDTETKLLIIIIASSTIFQSMNVVDFYFQSKVLSRYVVFANTITLLVSSAVKILLIVNDASLVAFAWVVLFDSFILSLGHIYFYLKSGKRIKHWVFDKYVGLRLLKDSWPLIFSGIVISIYMKIDQVMIKSMLDSEAVGQYSAAVKLIEAWYFVPIVIVSSVFPAIVGALEKGEVFFYNQIQVLYNLFFILSLMLAIFGSLYSVEIIYLTFGEEYLPASDILIVYIWSSVFIFHGCVRSRYLIAINKQFIGLQFRVVGALVNIVLNYFLIKKYGVIGAAYASVISFALPVYLLALKYDVLKKDLVLTWKAYSFLWVFRK